MTEKRIHRLGVLFPGSRHIWLAAAFTLAVGVVVLVRLLSGPIAPLTGTNSVGPSAVVENAAPGERACIRDLRVPPQTTRIEIWMGFPNAVGPTTVSGTVSSLAGAERISSTFRRPEGGFQGFDLPEGVGDRAMGPTTVCVTSPNHLVALGGASVSDYPGRPRSTVGGRRMEQTDIAVRWLGPESQISVLSALPNAFERATTFKSGRMGAVAFWLLTFLWLPVGYLVVRTAAQAERHSLRQLATRAALLAAFAATGWALLMPPFYGADESEHFAYVQHVAETGERASSDRSPRPAYSDEQALLMGTLHHSSTIIGGTRPRWDQYWAERFYPIGREALQDNGGGYSESATGHSPLYYALIALPYRALDGPLNLPQLVIATRLFTALLAAMVAALSVVAAALLFQTVRIAWWIAGVVAALQPVFSSVAATINNDTLVNLLAASAVVLLLDAWRNGPSAGRMTLLGVAALLAPVAKGTGFAVWPVVAIGLVVVLIEHHSRRSLLALAAVPAAMVGTLAAWVAVLGPLTGNEPGLLLNVHPAAPGAAAHLPPSWLERADYYVQQFLPFLHLTADHWTSETLPIYSIYIERGWAGFGWFNVSIGELTVRAIGIGVACTWSLALAAAVRNRARWREAAGGALILLTTILAVTGTVAYAYATPGGRQVLGEQGRYIFPALVPLATIVASGLFAFRSEQMRHVFAGVAVAAMPLLALVSWLTAVRDWYA